MADGFCEEYSSSLNDLTFNSKPHISMLTMLAEENSQFAPQIVKSIEAHLQKIQPEAKLPTLYLIDSIIKNVGHVYLNLFTQNLVSNFCSVFEKVDEKVRAQMYKLRQTWTDIFPNKKLYAIDIRVKELDPAWPILAQAPQQQTSIHINPKFLKSPAEDATTKTLQDLDGEVVRQKLLAKQQEMVRLQREKLELELLQTQAVVEEQKRQLMVQEQRLRNQQQQVDLQKKFTLHQLSNMGAALAVAAANQSLQLDPTKLKQLKVDGSSDLKDVGMKDQNQPVTTATMTAAINSKNSVNLSQTVISSLMSVSNKTIDANPLLMQESSKSISVMNQPQILNNSLQASSQLLTNMSNLKSVIQQPIVNKSSLETSVHKNIGSAVSNLEGKSEGVGLKTSPKMRSDKNEKDKNSSSKSKSPSSKKRSTSSTSKSKEEELSKSKVGDGSKISSRREPSSSSKANARSKSNSLSPSKSRGSGKVKQWSPSSSSARKSSNHSRSRSPNRRDKNRDRDERGSKRERRSPRRDKENDTGSSRSKSSTKSDDEPPSKKSKSSDAELDEIFGGKDQDYRQLDHPKLSPGHSTEYQGWAQYKASRPEQFKSAMRSRDSNDHRDPFGFGKQDLDLRTNTTLPVRGKLPTPWLPYRIPKINQAKDGRLFDRPGGPAVHPRIDPRLLAQGANNFYQATRESDPSIPRALMFDRGSEIMRQADSQLRSGQLTVDQHREIMEQLAKLYELQRMRHMQREQHMRESIMSHRSDIGQQQDVVASSPEVSPRPESEISKVDKPTKGFNESVTSTEESERNELDNKMEQKLPEVETSNTQSEAADEEVSILLEAKPDTLKEKTAIEVVISDDDDDDVRHKSKIKNVKEKVKDSNNSRSPSKPPGKCMPVNTVMIDDQPREVRFFGSVAIVLLENDDPREIAFRGPPQEVIIGKQVIRLGFNNEKKEFEIDNVKHTICFGAPTRELFIDDVPYCAVFGGPPITVTLNGKSCELKLCGPTPEVFFGDKPRHDMLPKIMEIEAEDKQNSQHQQQLPSKPLIVDKPASPSGRWGGSSKASRDYDSRDWRSSNREESFQRGSNMGSRDDWPISMPQQSRGSMRFNDEPYRSERNGPYRDDQRGPPILSRGSEVWARRDDPRNRYGGPVPPMRGDMIPEPGGRHVSMNEFYEDDGRSGPLRPRPGGYYMDPRYGGPGPLPPMMRRHPMGGMPTRFDEAGMPMRPMAPHSIGGPPHPMGPLPPGGMKYRPQYVNYPRMNPHERFGGPPMPDYPYLPNQHMQSVNYNPPAPPPPQPQININELFDKLVSTGIIPQVSTTTNTESSQPTEEEAEKSKVPDEKVPPIEMSTDSLKIKRPVIFALLYNGIQCSSCGVRFTAEQTDKYAQHLDWHFRQNRREKDSARKALSRKWYYDVQDWVQFEEIEDLEERARSFFEIQTSEEHVEENEESGPSVPAGENEDDKKCAVCQELFELYWDEEHEEWHFRDAVRHEEKNYHPLCYEDFKEQSMIEEPSKDEKMEEETKMQNETTHDVIKEELAIKSESETQDLVDEVIKEGVTIEEELMDVDKVVEVDIDSLPTEREKDEKELTKEDECMEIEESSLSKPTEENEEPFLGVFNVLSTSYKIPPLLLWDSEDALETKKCADDAENGEDSRAFDNDEESSETQDSSSKEDTVIKTDDDNNIKLTEIENADDNDDEATDLNAVEYNDIESAFNSELIKPEEHELAESPIEDSVDDSVSRNEQNSNSVGEKPDEQSVTNQIACSLIDNVVNDNVHVSEEHPSENVVIVNDDFVAEQMSLDKNEIIDSEALSAHPVQLPLARATADDDVVLKESSDVISDFSFDPTELGTVDDNEMHTDVATSDQSLLGKDNEDSDDEEAVVDEPNDSKVKFVVQPPVTKGTEVSGLCSIM